MAEYEQIGTRTPDGLKICAAATDKLAFYGATPVVKQAHIADATDATTVIAQLNTLLSQLETYGLLATS